MALRAPPRNRGWSRFPPRDQALLFSLKSWPKSPPRLEREPVRLKRGYRSATGTQEFAATAPLNLVYVVDQSKQPGDFDARRKLVTACTDAGFIGENVYLFCASEGLGTVFRAMINANYIQQCLKLPVLKKVLYAQSVGYPSKS